MGVKNVAKGWFYLHRRNIIIALCFLSLLAVPARAGTICLDNYTMSIPFNYTVGYAGNLHNITISKDMPCAYGCAENTCNPDPFWAIAGAIAGLVAFVGGLFWVVKRV